MVAKITGNISEVLDKSIVIDTAGGVAYEIFVTLNDLAKIKTGEKLTIWTELVVREDSQSLYGFLDNESRKTFNILQKVSGVGPKMALQILEQFDFSQLQSAIEQADTSVFKQVPGVGNKLAQKIILELKGSVDLSGDLSGKQLPSAKADAISGLVNLGYKKQDVETVVAEIDSDNTSEIIKIALQSFAK